MPSVRIVVARVNPVAFFENNFPLAFNNKLKFPLDKLDKALKKLRSMEFKQISAFYNVSPKDPSKKYLSKYI